MTSELIKEDRAQSNLLQSHGVVNLEAGWESEVDYRNWHATSSAIEATVNNLSHRSIENLVGALRQIENILPDLNTDIGIEKDKLDLPKVGFMKKLIALLFVRRFPELRGIINRAELRESAETKLKILERVRTQLRDLRQRVVDEIDDLLESQLKAKNPDAYEICQMLRQQREPLRANLVRIEALKSQIYLVRGSPTYYEDSDYRTTLRSLIFIYEEISENKLADLEKRGVVIANKFIGFETSLREKLRQIESRRRALLQPLWQEPESS